MKHWIIITGVLALLCLLFLSVSIWQGIKLFELSQSNADLTVQARQIRSAHLASVRYWNRQERLFRAEITKLKGLK